MNSLAKSTIKAAMSQDAILSVLINFFEEEENLAFRNVCEDRLKKLEDKIENINLFCGRLKDLLNDQTKYIHMRNFLKFYFYKSDPALIDVNVKIIIDYVLDKNNYDIYDLLLEKMCLLNKYSIEILEDIKNLFINSDGYYSWEDYLDYNKFKSNKSFTEFLCANSDDVFYVKTAFGFKSLIDGDFVSNYPTLYPGKVDVNSVDNFMLTNLGHKLIQYIQ